MDNVETVEVVEESNPVEVPANPLELFTRLSDSTQDQTTTPAIPTEEVSEEEVPEVVEEVPEQELVEEEVAPPEPVAAKVVKAVNGDSEIEIPEGAKFKAISNDGTEIEFTVKEAINSFKTSRERDRDFSKLDLERKSLTKEKEFIKKAKQDIEIIDKNVALINQEAQRGNIMGVAQIVLNMAGGNNAEIVKQLVQQSQELTEKFAGMTPEQQADYIDKQQLILERNALLAEKQQVSEVTTRQELKNFVHSIKDSYQITDEELGAAFTKLEKKGHKFPEEAKDVAKDCANWVLAERQFDKIVSAIGSVSPARKEDAQLIDAIASLVEPTFTQDDIADIVSGYLGTKKISATSTTRQNSSREVSGAAPRNGVAVKQKAPPQRANGVTNAGKSAGKPILSYQDLIAKYAD